MNSDLVKETIDRIAKERYAFRATFAELDLPPKEFMEILAELAEKHNIDLSIQNYLQTKKYKQTGIKMSIQEMEKLIPKKEGYYRYIPEFLTDFVRDLKNIIAEYDVKSFLDVGAGYGDKVFTAQKLGLKSSGIEYVDDYIKGAEEFGVKNIIKEDALDYTGYNQYDLIYMFHPIENTKLYIKMLNRIMSQMLPGQLIWETYPSDAYTYWENLSDSFETLSGYTKEKFVGYFVKGVLVRKIK
jgi:hypothetical protein